ncbi:hypothetical protein A2V82_03000 [candidate division KSB1 bacterium RBG_16_48_16]|nr:MAG: hypothetical protein A2V82_03000 [candidate division KSB1 bacterium RBG_16_48_16]
MNNRIIEILTYIMKEIQENSVDGLDLQLIVDLLADQGFSQDEIKRAMIWLMNHGDNLDRSINKKNSGIPRPLWRQLNDFERDAISPSAFGYLVHLRELDLLSDDDMETIIDRAVKIQLPHMNIEDMQDLIAVVVLDFEKSASGGYFQFTSTRLPH